MTNEEKDAAITRLTRERDEARAALTALQSYQVQYDDLQDENAKLQGERDAARTQASAFAHAAAEARETAYDLRALLRELLREVDTYLERVLRIKAALEE